jgi:ATP-dependent DNA helicase RecG
MTETNDGFRIAEADLEIRGPGEFFGTRQHGLPDLRIASLVEDQKLLSQARADAFAALGLSEEQERKGTPSVDRETLGRWRDILQRRIGRNIPLADIA